VVIVSKRASNVLLNIYEYFKIQPFRQCYSFRYENEVFEMSKPIKITPATLVARQSPMSRAKLHQPHYLEFAIPEQMSTMVAASSCDDAKRTYAVDNDEYDVIPRILGGIAAIAAVYDVG
jgi:hypothetical protein